MNPLIAAASVIAAGLAVANFLFLFKIFNLIL